MPGIDALRAIAVLAVFLYHAGGGWTPGGFLGVDVFFVISGYLITSLLLGELRRRGHIRVGRFWARRARRLLPAVGVFVAATMVVAAIVEPERIAHLRGDAISALLYVANWHFVLSDQSYFDQFQRPSLFRHLWSLSVEEQFYLLWPLAFAAGMKLLGRLRLALGVLAGAAASLALAWLMFDPLDASRVYYGTDTHAVGLLAGVGLALVWAPWDLRRGKADEVSGPLLDGLGALALAYLALAFLSVHDYDLGLYHGGYLWVALAAAVLVGALAHPGARLGALLARPSLVWLGLRSYSFYLWHWPVLALTRPGIDVALPRWLLVPLQLAATLALADLSYRFVELPFRGGPKPARLPDGWLRLARPALVAAVAATVFMVGWGGVAGDGRSQLPDTVAAASTAESATVVARVGRPTGPGSPASRPNPGPPRIVALGDSVMIGAKRQLAARLGPAFSMNAHVGRQAPEFIELARALRAHGPPDALIVQMGNNGPLYGDDMRAMYEATRGVGHLFFVSDHAPVSWIGESNEMLAEAAEDWPRTSLIDWDDVAGRDGLTWDGAHLTPEGAQVYANLVAGAVKRQLRAGRASTR